MQLTFLHLWFALELLSQGNTLGFITKPTQATPFSGIYNDMQDQHKPHHLVEFITICDMLHSYNLGPLIADVATYSREIQIMCDM